MLRGQACIGTHVLPIVGNALDRLLNTTELHTVGRWGFNEIESAEVLCT